MREKASDPSTSAEICNESMAVMTGYGIRIYICHRPPHDDGSWHEELYREDTGVSSGYSWAPEPVISNGVPYTAFTTDRPRRGGKTTALERVTRGHLESARTHEWDDHCESALAIVAER